MRNGKLTDALVHAATRAGKYHDGAHGLFLRVMASGSRQWVQRIVVQGKTREFGLGGYPIVTLAEARQRSLANRRVARAGGDPAAMLAPPLPPMRTHSATPGIEPATVAPTFAAAAEQVIEIQSARWRNGGKSAAQWRSSLATYVVPYIGDLGVDRIETHHVVAILEPIWKDKQETARRVRQRVSAVMDWAVASGYRQRNPVHTVGALLPRSPPTRTHYPALPYQDVSAAVQQVLNSRAWDGTRIALVFLVLTACRSGEVRAAETREIDWTNDIWVIPGSRTKTSRQHRVPLSDGARFLLDSSPLDKSSGLLFPSKAGRVMSDSTLSKLLRSLELGGVPHGFRSSFRDWSSEVAKAPREVAELSLSHVIYSGAEAAYARSDLLERRRELMQEWCDYLDLNRPSIGRS